MACLSILCVINSKHSSVPHSFLYPRVQLPNFALPSIQTLALATWLALASGMSASIILAKAWKVHEQLGFLALALCHLHGKHLPTLASWSERKEEKHREQRTVTSVIQNMVTYSANNLGTWVNPVKAKLPGSTQTNLQPSDSWTNYMLIVLSHWIWKRFCKKHHCNNSPC